MATLSDSVLKTKQKQESFLLLLNAKCAKVSNEHLVKTKHTQLSYLPQPEQEWHLAIVKDILLDRFIRQLNQL